MKLEINYKKKNTAKKHKHNKSSSEREVHSSTNLSQEEEKAQINNLNLHLKHFKKEEQKVQELVKVKKP